MRRLKNENERRASDYLGRRENGQHCVTHETGQSSTAVVEKKLPPAVRLRRLSGILLKNTGKVFCFEKSCQNTRVVLICMSCSNALNSPSRVSAPSLQCSRCLYVLSCSSCSGLLHKGKRFPGCFPARPPCCQPLNGIAKNVR